ncbi:MAG: hypothetical protein QE283_02280 [Rhodoferax sp.]|nr:hypothetical protein [Rhodoferax sp.]
MVPTPKLALRDTPAQWLVRAHGVALLVALCLVPAQSWAWNPFETKSAFQESELSAGEWKQIEVKAGWAADADTTLLIEATNKLPGPLACHGALVNLQNGTEVKKSFSPYLYIPPGATRQAGVNGVKKGQMKGYTLSCNCWKKAGDARCVDPKKPG